jgi:hypothetical protein
MNLQVHHVLPDITGLSGMAIVEAIVAGQRDPRQTGCLVPRQRAIRAGNGRQIAAGQLAAPNTCSRSSNRSPPIGTISS